MGGWQRKLLAWYRRQRRVLPWRSRPSAYRVWVSELMLQQTQVKTVLPFFARFMARFPNVRSLAAAREEEVLALWSGLGYYRRARALHRAARIIVGERGGRFPDTLEGWLALPGVGRYTAGAILSIAYRQRVPILDGNVIRVLTRIFLIRGNPRLEPTKARLWKLAEDVLPRRNVSDFNQALMELGALVCTPRRPACPACPVRLRCAARRQGLAEVLPELGARRPTVEVDLVVAVVRSRGRLLMYRRDERLMQGLWELPGGYCPRDEEPRRSVVRELRERYGLRAEAGAEVARVKHHIMNQRITLYAFRATLLRKPPALPGRVAWISPDKIERYPLSSMTKKVLQKL